MRRVYLDHNATSPLRPQAREAILEVLDLPGNASSIHREGQAARRRLDRGRTEIASIAGVAPAQLFFTSGATEANNWVLHGREQRVLVSAIEHLSVLGARPDAERLQVDRDGIIDLDALAVALAGGPSPVLVSLMLVNNETGAIQPVREAATIVHRHGGSLHCDAVQAFGRMKLDVETLGVDYLTLSAHKLGGPQGIGALIVAPGVDPAPLIRGGAQEHYRRAGTENIAGVAGFAAAAIAASDDLADYGRITGLRDFMETALTRIAPGLVVHARGAPRAGNTSLFSVPSLAAETQLMALDLAGIAVSSGAACSSGKVAASHVLKAMNGDRPQAEGAVRVSLGWSTNADDVAYFVLSWQKLYERHALRMAETSS